MAIKTYVAKQVRQLERHKLTVTAVAVAGTVALTINSKAVTYKCVTGDTVDTAASGLLALIRAAEDAEFRQFSASIDATVTAQINIDVSTAGLYLTPDGNTALTVTGAGGATITSAVVQQGLSPADAGDVLNWSGGALPAGAGDTWYFEDAPFPAWYRLSTLAAKAAAAIYVRPQFVGNGIGLPKFNRTGQYAEYVGGRLTVVSCAILDVNLPDGAQREAYRFDVGNTVACALVVRGQGQPQVGQEAVDWIGVHANNTAEVDGGSLKIAGYVGEVSTLASVKINGGACTLGEGVTVATVVNQGGALDMSCAVSTSLTQDGDDANAVIRGTGAIPTLTIEGGKVFHNGTGTITDLVVGPGATLDFSGSKAPITVTNKALFYIGSTVWDPYGRVTWTNGYQTIHCAASECVLNFGVNRNYTVA